MKTFMVVRVSEERSDQVQELSVWGVKKNQLHQELENVAVPLPTRVFLPKEVQPSWHQAFARIRGEAEFDNAVTDNLSTQGFQLSIASQLRTRSHPTMAAVDADGDGLHPVRQIGPGLEGPHQSGQCAVWPPISTDQGELLEEHGLEDVPEASACAGQTRQILLARCPSRSLAETAGPENIVSNGFEEFGGQTFETAALGRGCLGGRHFSVLNGRV